jgi:ribosomal protein S14
LMSGGLYIKASLLKQQADLADTNSDARPAKANTCDRCGKKEAAVQCRVHQVQMCPECLREHYDSRSCTYIPSARRMARGAGA